MHPHLALAQQVVHDLRPALPADLVVGVGGDGTTLSLNLRRLDLWAQTSRPYPPGRCEVVEWIASALQDFMADAYGVYWPSVGELRLTLEVECVGDRPRLVLGVPVHRAVQKG